MQKVRVLSSLTKELTQVTPLSALRSTTARQSSAPPLSIGMRRPSGKVRSTTYRGISFLLFAWPPDMTPSYGRDLAHASGGPPMLGVPPPYLFGVAGTLDRRAGRLDRPARTRASSRHDRL